MILTPVFSREPRLADFKVYAKVKNGGDKSFRRTWLLDLCPELNNNRKYM